MGEAAIERVIVDRSKVKWIGVVVASLQEKRCTLFCSLLSKGCFIERVGSSRGFIEFLRGIKMLYGIF